MKEFQDCPVFAHGPLEIGAPNPIPLMAPIVPGSVSSGFGGGGDYSSQGYPRGQMGGQQSQGGQFQGRPFFGGRGDGNRGGRGDAGGRGRGDGGRGRGAGGRIPSEALSSSSYYQLQGGIASAPQMPSTIQGLSGAGGMRKKTRFE